MRIFEVKADLKSYTYPVVKTAIACAIISICLFRNQIIQINSEPMSTVIAIICGILAVLCILCIYVSVAEMFHAHENRTAKRSKLAGACTLNAKDYTVNKIVALAEKNEIIEIEVICKGKIVKIGASSDCKSSDSKFFDKLYYIDDANFATIGEFETALIPLCECGTVLSVIYIDGIHTK